MKHIFISYVRDDQVSIDKICTFLKSHEVPFWMDRKDLMPGKNWKISIRKAIEDCSLFIACFSDNYLSKNESFMNEELILAIECLRKKTFNSSWFIPVRLDNCKMPELEIGGGRLISDIQSLDFFEDFDAGKKRLLDVIKANEIPFNTNEATDNVGYGVELKYLSLKALIDIGDGRYFHNADMGHPVYIAGAVDKGQEPWEYADGPEQNTLYIRLKEASKELLESGYSVDEYIWWYDFDTWKSFCKYVSMYELYHA